MRRLLLASAACSSNAVEAQELGQVLLEIFSASPQVLSDVLASRLGLFGIADFTGSCRKTVEGAPPGMQNYQSALWTSVRGLRPPPLASAVLAIANSQSPIEPLERPASFLALAQNRRLTAAQWFADGELHEEVKGLVDAAAADLAAWATFRSAAEIAAGVAEWPVVALLAELEAADFATVRAVGVPEAGRNPTDFGPYDDPRPTRMTVLPGRDIVSSHNRMTGHFHCSVELYYEVHAWALRHPKPSQRLIYVEVGCHLGDCLLWAAHRLGGRLRAVCFEGDELAVAAARRSVAALGLEGQVEIILRQISSSPPEANLSWACSAGATVACRSACCRLAAPGHSGQAHSFVAETSPAKIASIDDEVARLGLGPLDILHVTATGDVMDMLKSAEHTLTTTEAALVMITEQIANTPRYMYSFMSTLHAAGFDAIFKRPKAPMLPYIVAHRGVSRSWLR